MSLVSRATWYLRRDKNVPDDIVYTLEKISFAIRRESLLKRVMRAERRAKEARGYWEAAKYLMGQIWEDESPDSHPNKK